MNKSERECLGLEPPDMTVVLCQYLNEDENQKFAEGFRLYSKAHPVMKAAQKTFLLSLAIFCMSFLPAFPMPTPMMSGSGLLAVISLLLLWLIRPSLETAIDQLQRLSDKALIRARLRPVDLVTGKPK